MIVIISYDFELYGFMVQASLFFSYLAVTLLSLFCLSVYVSHLQHF